MGTHWVLHTLLYVVCYNSYGPDVGLSWPKHVVQFNLYKTSCNQDSIIVVFDSY